MSIAQTSASSPSVWFCKWELVYLLDDGESEVTVCKRPTIDKIALNYIEVPNSQTFTIPNPVHLFHVYNEKDSFTTTEKTIPLKS